MASCPNYGEDAFAGEDGLPSSGSGVDRRKKGGRLELSVTSDDVRAWMSYEGGGEDARERIGLKDGVGVDLEHVVVRGLTLLGIGIEGVSARLISPVLHELSGDVQVLDVLETVLDVPRAEVLAAHRELLHDAAREDDRGDESSEGLDLG